MAARLGLKGFEPLTLRLSSACSNQLSYRPGFPVRPEGRKKRWLVIADWSSSVGPTNHGSSPALRAEQLPRHRGTEAGITDRADRDKMKHSAIARTAPVQSITTS